MDALEAYATEDIRKQSTDMLDTVGRMRAIGVASRQRLQANNHAKPTFQSEKPYHCMILSFKQIIVLTVQKHDVLQKKGGCL